jgi:hypothetical protein
VSNLTATTNSSYSSTQTYSASGTATDSYSNYQAGCFANGSYAFTSAVLQSAGTATSFEHLYAYHTASGAS